jgi:hypothetical protein
MFFDYGSRVVANPDQLRLPMAGIDPRQRGLFAAAWAIGAVAATEQYGILSMALATPVGPLGIIYRKAEWSQPIYDDGGGAVVFPLFHVVRALSQIATCLVCQSEALRGAWGAPVRPVSAIEFFFLPICPTSRDV